MNRCPYAAALVVNLTRVLVRCERRAILTAWHLHDAPLPAPAVEAHRNVRVRWRSSSAPDYHVEHTRGPATVVQE
jgi:hypothetical protein